jgi:hypothetical protein
VASCSIVDTRLRPLSIGVGKLVSSIIAAGSPEFALRTEILPHDTLFSARSMKGRPASQ